VVPKLENHLPDLVLRVQAVVLGLRRGVSKEGGWGARSGVGRRVPGRWGTGILSRSQSRLPGDVAGEGGLRPGL
jgi:hypothetical protein